MKLDDAAVTVPGEARRRYDRLGADLEIRPCPDDSRLDRADRLPSKSPVHRGREGDFDQRKQLIERLPEPDVLHAALEIGEAVFEGEAVIEGSGIRKASALGLGGKVEAEITGNRKGPQIGKRARDIAEPLTEIEGR